MAEKFVSLAPVGVVTAIVGEVRVTSLDGTTRLLAAGDTVSTGDVVETSANGAVHIQLANGRSVDCGEQFSLKVSEKGAVSVYGLGRFPVTLYKEQWTRLLEMADDIRTFIADNEGKLKAKE